jgi:hypothetical protein
MATDVTVHGRNDLCGCGSGKKFKECHGVSGKHGAVIASPATARARRGQFSEFISKPVVGPALDTERRSLLAEIGRIRNTEVLAYSALMQMPVAGPMNLVTYEDILIVQDLINGLRGDRITVILETPGGIGEVGRQIVEMLHARFSHVEFLVPGWAKSTGTIMVMGGHEILMGPASALGPIDAQLTQDGKTFSADAFIEGVDNIKKEVEKTGKLNAAYIPILQKISPGELQHAQNAKDFATVTVQEWLNNYKFGNWHQHEQSKQPVTSEERAAQAREIAEKLCSQALWKTHGRSISMRDLRDLGLKITDFSENADLNKAVLRFQVLLFMTLRQGNVAKIVETAAETIAVRFNVQQPAGQPVPPATDGGVTAGVMASCPKCGRKQQLQLDFDPGIPRDAGTLRFPNDNKLSCPNCATVYDVGPARAEAEKLVGRKALTPQPTGS